jgi:diguanylate cyclase (GGDEF)-like protein/putative nucleotidyltransferase with HDIG domain/PAS domain S-box-containing protein
MDTSHLLMGLMSFSKVAELKDLDVPISKELAGAISPNVLRVLLSSLRFRDPATVDHTRRVAMLATGIAEYVGWEHEEQKKLEIAGLLHDIGKIGVPDSILFKPGSLGPEELSLLALHHSVGVDLLQTCKVDDSVLNFIIQSHRDYDLPLAELSQGARILSIADAYDSLCSDHVYRDGLSHAEAIEVIRGAAGIQFDGNIIDALCSWIDTEGIQFEKSSFRMKENSQLPVLNLEESDQVNMLGHICSYLYILENLYDGFFIVDSDLHFSVWNCGMEKLYGKTIGDSLGQSWTTSHIEYLDKREKRFSEEQYPLNQVIQSKKSLTTIIKIRRPEGQINEIEVQAIPIFDPHGKLHGIIEIHRNLSETQEQSAKVRDLKIAASRDALTGVINRGELESQLAKLLVQQSEDETGQVFSVIFLDVDHFKSVNDTYGHSVGDNVLIEMTQLLDKETYSGEVIGRFGGEEFVLLCPETDINAAYKKTERLRMAIANCREGALGDCQITSSFGITESVSGDSVESIFRRVDEALYKSKENGRNRTTISCSIQGLDPGANCDNEGFNSDPFCFNRTLKAFTTSDLLSFKLRGFVNDQNAKVFTSSREEIQFQVGKTGFFSKWRRDKNRQPVVVTLKPQLSTDQRVKKTSKLTRIEVSIVPMGTIHDAEIFNLRANDVFRSLSAYFIANSDESQD